MTNQKILALDTSGPLTSVSILTEGRIVSSSAAGNESSHNEEVWSATERVISSAGLKVSDLNHLVIGLGPGSFTGLRIGLAFLKGLSQSLKIGLTGYGSLRCLAYNGHTDGSLVIGLSDAGRSQFYCSFELIRNQLAEQIGDHQILSRENLVREIETLKQKHLTEIRSVAVYNAGSLSDGSLNIDGLQVQPMPDISVCLLNAHAALSSQKEADNRGQNAISFEELRPFYIRPVSALSIADRGLPPPRH